MLTIALERLAEETGLSLPEGEASALARSLPRWPVFEDAHAGARGGARPRLASRDPLEHRPRPDRRVDGGDRDRVPGRDRRGGDRLLQAGAQALGGVPGADRRDRRETHVHVAQSLFHDIEPATELGIPRIWINRLGEPDDPRPARTLPDVSALADALDELVPG